MTTKDDARKFIRERAVEYKPPPTQKEIRERMGWNLIDAARKAAKLK